MPLAVRTIAALVLVVAAAPAAAQARHEISVAGVAVSADHPLLGDALVGGSLRLSTSFLDGRLLTRVGVESVSGSADRVGSTCVGLVPIGAQCDDQPLRDDGRLTTILAGLAVRVFGTRAATLRLTADLRGGSVSADTRALVGNGTLNASKSVIGGDVGVEGAWTPAERIPLALEGGVAAGRLEPLSRMRGADFYAPFERNFAVRRLWLGLSVRTFTR